MTAIRICIGFAGMALILLAQAQADPPEDGCANVCLEKPDFIASPAMTCWSYDDASCAECMEGRCKGTPLPDPRCDIVGTTKMRRYSPGCAAKCDVPLNKFAEASMGSPPQIGNTFDSDWTICTIPLGVGLGPP